MSVKYCHRELSTYHRYQQKKKVAKKKTTTTNTVNLFQDLTVSPYPRPFPRFRGKGEGLTEKAGVSLKRYAGEFSKK
jgi:hypothetical protein